MSEANFLYRYWPDDVWILKVLWTKVFWLVSTRDIFTFGLGDSIITSDVPCFRRSAPFGLSDGLVFNK
jgi:hypothetical protein